MGHPANPYRRLDQRWHPAVIREEQRLIFTIGTFLLTSLPTTTFITLLWQKP